MSKTLKVQFGLMMLLAGMFLLWNGGAKQAAAGDAAKETMTGTLVVRWLDPAPGSAFPAQTEYYLRDDNGEYIRLAITEADIARLGGMSNLKSRKIKIGFDESVRRTTSETTPLVVESIEPVSDDQDAVQITNALLGNKKFVNILCRFPDTPEEPYQTSFYDNLFRETYPGLGHYWRELSYNQMNVEGSIAVGWYVLPRPQAYYYTDGFLDRRRFANACATAADADVYFPDFYGVNFITNRDYVPGIAGEGVSNFIIALDGVTREYGATWIYRNASDQHSAIAHEMGHSFGLFHSSGGHGNDYDSRWDVMSSSYISPLTPGFGYVGQHTISAYKDRLGWIPEARRFTPPLHGATTIDISPLAAGPFGRRYLMALIPLNTNGQFYSVEVRNLAGYDQYLPAQAVVIHYYNGTSATVIDADGNTNPNDAGAQWTIGETFEDTANRIRVTVNSESLGVYSVTVERNAGCTYSLSSTGASFPGEGGNGSFEVITQPGCSWNLSGAGQYRDFAADGFQIYDAPIRSPFVGLAENYPSTATVTGFSGQITKARVRLQRLSHVSPGDIDMILVAPNGVASMIMSDANGTLDSSGSELLIDQFAAGPLNQTGANPSGTYQPANYETANDIFPAPGPGTGIFAADLNLFNGLNPNGDWKLFVVDDSITGIGSLGRGWALEVADTSVVSNMLSGIGPATINYAVTANYGRPRTLTLQIAGQTFTISQL